MNFWKKVIHQPVSKEHRNSVMMAVRETLRENQEKQEIQFISARRNQVFQWIQDLFSRHRLALPATGLAVALASTWVWRSNRPEEADQQVAEQSLPTDFDPELLQDLELLADLEFFELIEEMDLWDET